MLSAEFLYGASVKAAMLLSGASVAALLLPPPIASLASVSRSIWRLVSGPVDSIRSARRVMNWPMTSTVFLRELVEAKVQITCSAGASTIAADLALALPALSLSEHDTDVNPKPDGNAIVTA